MLWRGRKESDNVEDVGDSGGSGGFPGGGGFRIPMGRGGVGGGLGLLVILGLCLFFGVDPRVILDNGGPVGGGGGGVNIPMPRFDPEGEQQAPQRNTRVERPASTQDAELKQFVSVVLADTEDVWGELFKRAGKTYEKPKLLIFRNTTQSACGRAKAAMGPFYCPDDRTVYADLAFYQELKDRFKAPGDFAQAYVIAHEVGHHVQNLLGIVDKVDRAKEQAGGEEEVNALQVRVELQADCFAGVWANQDQKLNKVLEEGDIDEALTAASAIGDDKIQKQTQGYVTPDSFTHGSSEQRQRWFRAGFDSGKVASCNTFGADKL